MTGDNSREMTRGPVDSICHRSLMQRGMYNRDAETEASALERVRVNLWVVPKMRESYVRQDSRL
jgi:hypothetical protein